VWVDVGILYTPFGTIPLTVCRVVLSGRREVEQSYADTV